MVKHWNCSSAYSALAQALEVLNPVIKCAQKIVLNLLEYGKYPFQNS